ncbi:TPA: hypothetical protein ACJG67_002801 [Salmonella enterica subsp. enterica serovar Kottbus]
MINAKVKAPEWCAYLKRKIENAHVERARAFSRLTVLYCVPDRFSGRDVKVLNADKLNAAFKAFECTNTKLIRLVQAYNKYASEAGEDKIEIIVQE